MSGRPDISQCCADLRQQFTPFRMSGLKLSGEEVRKLLTMLELMRDLAIAIEAQNREMAAMLGITDDGVPPTLGRLQ